MPTLQFLIDEVEKEPEGAHIAAFFDMDRTLIHGFSSQDIFLEQITSREISLESAMDQISQAIHFARGKIDFNRFIARTVRHLRGHLDARNFEFGRRVFEKRIAARIYPEARALIDAHMRKGHIVVIVSAATPYQVQPVAHDLGVDAFLCTHLELENGICTGNVIDPPCYGEGKSIAVRNFVAEHDIHLDESYFYSDGHEDLPLLNLVGRPRPLNPDKKLSAVARARNWPVTRFESRGRPKPADFIRTGLAYLSAGPAAAAAAFSYSLNRSPRQARNVFQTFWGELSSASIGLKLNVEGEEHIWSQRPVVFMANHQSAVDAIAVMKLLRGNVTAIAKKEVKTQPIIGQMASVMGTIFVDRSNNKQAREALAPAVTALESGISIIIFPEGTRSPTNKLARFKKGGFHIAMQAGVPIVPIVLKNTTDSMPKGSVLAKPATIDVKILPPIPTRDWEVQALDRHIQDVKDLFLEQLHQADGDTAMPGGHAPSEASKAMPVRKKKRKNKT